MNMNIPEFLKILEGKQISISLQGENLKVDSDQREIQAEIREKLVSLKPEIIAYLKSKRRSPELDYEIQPASLSDSYPLSSSQHRLWILSHFAGGETAYNIPGMYVFEGYVNQKALEASFIELCTRHEILRTVFRENEQGEPRQWICQVSELPLQVHFRDLRGLEQQENKLSEILQSEVDSKLNLATGPLLKMTLLQLEDSRYVFACVMHHIISDGWSMVIMIRELMELYNAASTAKVYKLAPLRIQYKDYAVWQQMLLNTGKLKQQENFWIEQFQGALPVLELPTDKPRPAQQTYNGDLVEKWIDPVLTRKIKVLELNTGSTLYMKLLAAVNLLLFRYTNQEDIIIGSPIAGRTHPDLADQIGFYINTLPIRVRLKSTDTFHSLLGHIKQVTLAAYEHQEYPFDKLLQNLKLVRNIGRNPLFDVMVVLENFNTQTVDDSVNKFEGIRLSEYTGIKYQTSKVDMTFFFSEVEDRIRLLVEYNTDLYDKETILRLQNNFEKLLSEICAEPGKEIGELDYLDEKEKNDILYKFNSTEHSYPAGKTLADLFLEQVKKQRESVSIVHEDVAHSFGEVDRLSSRLAVFLISNMGMKKGSRIGILQSRGLDLMTSILGVIRAGGAYVPLDKDYPEERLLYMIEDAGIEILLTEQALLSHATQLQEGSKILKQVLCIDREEETIALQACEGKTPAVSINPTDLAYVIYTSGSTGKPKGCMLEHGGVVNRIEWMWHDLGFKAGERVLQKTTFTFDVSVWEIFLPMCWGNQMVICSKEDSASPSRLLEIIRKHQVNSLHFVPSMLKPFLAEMSENPQAKESLSSVRRMITSGEALPAESVRKWYSLVEAPLHNLYGPTEASIDVTWHKTRRDDPIIPIGKPIWNTRMYLLGKRQELLPVGVPGEICIAGIGLARGYLNAAELNKEKFIPNPYIDGDRLYRTGDLGKWTSDGSIIYLGRFDDQVKIRGFRIELGEVETTFEEHEQIVSAAIIIRENSVGEKDMHLYYTALDKPAENELRAYLKNRLPAYMVPSFFTRLEEMPLSASGKTNKKVLQALAFEISGLAEYEVPLGKREIALEQIWSDVLGLQRISVTENFFNMGGDSIKALRLLSQINKIFATRLEISEFYKHPTIRETAASLQENKPVDQEALEEILLDIEKTKKDILSRMKEEEQGAIEDIYPMSEIGKGMAFENLMSENFVAYHIQFLYPTAYPDFNPAYLKEALEYMIQKHPILRTVLNLNDFSEQVNIVYKQIPAELEVDDISAFSRSEQKSRIKAYLKAELGTFQIHMGRLWRLKIFTLEKSKQIIVWQFHNSMLDGWSNASFVTELSNYYISIAAQEHIHVVPLQASFKDAVIQELLSKKDSKSKAYWLAELSGYKRLDVFSDEKMDTSYDAQFGNHLHEKLMEVARKHDTHPQAICFAAYSFLMAALSCEEDVTIGLTYNTRPVVEDGDKILGCFLNTLPVRTKHESGMTWKEYVSVVSNKIIDCRRFQSGLSDIRNIVPEEQNVDHNPFFDTYFNFINFHIYNDLKLFEEIANDDSLELTEKSITNTFFDFTVSVLNNQFHVNVTQTRKLASGMSVAVFVDKYIQVLEQIVSNMDEKITSLPLSLEERQHQLIDLNATEHAFPENNTLVDLFDAQVAKTPNEIALVFEDVSFTYRNLDEESDRLTKVLMEDLGLKLEDRVGILLSRGKDMMVSILGTIKAGGAYVPLDVDYPEDRLLFMIQDAGIEVLITERALAEFANRLQWRSESLKHLVCIDSSDFNAEQGGWKNELMQKELWDSVGTQAENTIAGGGWMSSYTGEDFSEAEMEEYVENTFQKLKGELRPDMKVLEIGCSSGLTLLRIAPFVGSYYGIDLSSDILKNTSVEVKKRGLQNVFLHCLPAHEIDQLNISDFDLIIINSVIHCFHGHNYLRNVLMKCVDLLKPQASLFLGDLMDESKRDLLIADLNEFHQTNNGKGYRTKTNWASELFISKNYLEDIISDGLGIVSVAFTDKIHTVANELTRFRFDALLRVNKDGNLTQVPRHKHQYDRRILERAGKKRTRAVLLPNNLAYIIYTSGSTGKPKGCMLEHRGIVNRIEWMWNELGFQPGETVLQKTTFTFDVSVWEIFLPLCWGNKMVICSKEDISSPPRLLELIQGHKINCLHFVPSMFKAFMEEMALRPGIKLAMKSIRRVITSGEALPLESVKIWYSMMTAPLHNLYGPTEASIDVSYHTTRVSDKHVPIGKPIWNTTLYILGKQQELLPLGVAGEICIGGIGLSRGYLNRPELTREKYLSHPFIKGERIYRTGDLGSWTTEGEIEYHGRLDDQVKIRGYRIELGEIENVAESYEYIQASAIIVGENASGDKHLHLFYVSREAVEENMLRSYLHDRLPAYMIPAFFTHLTEMPLTGSGKTNRKILMTLSKDTGIRSEDDTAPGNETELQLMKIWTAALGVSTMSTSHSFFHSGGDSIKALRLLNQINKDFQIQLKVGDLYKNPSISSLSKHILTAKNNAASMQEHYTRFDALKKEVLGDGKHKHLEDAYPMSDIEKGMILGAMLNPGAGVYHDQFIYPIEIEHFDADKFRKAVFEMCRKHDKLRTSYNIYDYSEPLSLVHKEAPVDIKYENIEKLKADKQEQYILNYMQEEREKPFEGDLIPLWRLTVFMLGSNRKTLLWQFHHAILDGWSSASFITELNNIYVALEGDEPYKMQPLAFCYKDYVATELAAKEDKQNHEFWKRELEDYKRLDIFSENETNKSASRTLGVDYFRSLNALAKTQKTSVNRICLSAYLYALKTISFHADMTVGLVSDNRPVRADADKILGCFLNTTPLRYQHKSLITWKKFVAEVEACANTLKEYPLTLFEINKVAGAADENQNPFFDTIFNYMDFHIYDAVEDNRTDAVGGQMPQLTGFNRNNTFFDLTVNVYDGVFGLSLNQWRELRSGITGEQFLDTYTRILDKMISSYESVIDCNEVSGARPHDTNSPPFPESGKTIVTLFEEAAELRPLFTALEFNGTNWTYAELDQKSNQVAHYLINELKVAPGDLIGIQMPRTDWWVVIVLGILKAGAAYMPMDPEFPDARVQHMLQDSACRLLVNEKLWEGIQTRLSYASSGRLMLRAGMNEGAYVMYTSGTTGYPKGVSILHRNVASTLNSLSTVIGWDSFTRLACATNFTFDISVLELFGSLCFGKTLLLFNNESILFPEIFLEQVIASKAQLLQITPSKLYQIMEITETLPICVNTVLVGGEAMHPDQYDWLKNQKKMTSFNMYGPTETTIWSACLNLSSSQSLSLGMALPAEQIFILDEFNNYLPQGVTGEISIGGTGVGNGYVNRTELTQEKFIVVSVEGEERLVYKTGDLGSLNPDGTFRFEGRKDYQVKIRGHRIEPEEIEAVLVKHPSISAAVLQVKANSGGQNELIAYIKTKDTIDIQALITFLGEELPSYIFPSYFKLVEEFPLTFSGKVDRKLLSNLITQELATGNDYQAASNPTEVSLVDIWREVLGKETIGVTDNFFLLGGHSLNVMQLIGKINKQFGCKLSIERFFESPTIQSLSEEIARMKVVYVKMDEEEASQHVKMTI
jgi:amino acid adenylation domain-containing protein